MKARIIKETAQEPITGQDGVLLTIGMIVKNEEKTLEECLQALQPLRDAIPCELIITDTGSADDTVKIAKRYADEVRFFEWTGDFAEARNTTLKNAKGAWYMYLDADEIFDDSVMKIAEFFKSGKYLQYQRAYNIIRNYNNYQHTSYMDFNALRLAKRTEELRFYGKIHEQLLMMEPAYHISALAHHEGYVRLKVGNLRKGKAIRNRVPLLEEIQKNPNSSRLYRHIADTYSAEIREEWEKKEECLKKGIAAEPLCNEEIYIGSNETELARFYENTAEEDKLHDLLKSWFARNRTPGLADCELSFIAGMHAYRNRQYETAITELEKFLEFYEKVQKGTDKHFDSDIIYKIYSTESGKNKAFCVIGICCQRLGQTEKAKQYMRRAQIGTSRGQDKKPDLIGFAGAYFKTAKDDELLCDIYHALWAEDHELTQRLFQKLQNQFSAPCRQWTALQKVLAETGDPQDPVTAICKLLLAGRNKEMQVDAEKEVQCILSDETACKGLDFAELAYVALNYPALAGQIFEKLNLQHVSACCAYVAIMHLDYARKVFLYFQNAAGNDSLKCQRWHIELLEQALEGNNDYTEEEWTALFEEYSRIGNRYYSSIYAAGFWNENNLDLFTGQEAFLCCIGLALEKKRNGDLAQYIRYLRMGLKHYEKMRNSSEFLLKKTQERMEKEEKEEKKEQEEMAELKKKVKANIKFLAGQNKKAEAAQLLRQYKLLAPQDPENASLETLLLE